MCGIAGFLGKGDKATGQKMIRSVSYRGPDYQGVFHAEKLCLAHARLSIIDLSPSAHQPMFTADKKLAIIFNGEIYNFLSLKKELQSLNKYTFSTSSDTEVLLIMYREFGVSMLEKVQGMFSFAIYDFQEEQLFLARDRMGKKPLYYTFSHDNTFVFASEIKAILQHPSVERNINLDAVNQYLTFDYVPTPDSIIESVRKLEPAHYMLVKNGTIIKKEAYWHHRFETNTNIRFEEAKYKLDHLLNNATEKRMISDVPLGVFLSGGLDSSAIAYYAQKNSAQKIKTFSIGFEDKSYGEQVYAKQVADHLGTEHHVSILTPARTLELIDEIFPLLDEPFADASIIPTYYLSAFTRKKVTVALGGDGSDELLAGYPTFISDRFKNFPAALPKGMIRFFLKLANLLPASDKNISLDFKIKQYLRGFSSGKKHIHQLWLGSFLPAEKEKLFKPDIWNSLNDKSGLEIIDKVLASEKPGGDFEKVLYFYYRTYLLDDILVKIDRASMYNSLEVRSPFLDTDVVEFANSLPRSFKQKGLNGKYILKKLMEDKLPAEIIYRPKKGFGIPLSDWIRKDLKKTIEETILAKDDYFNQAYLERLLKEHHSKKFNHRKLIWNLFVLKKVLNNLKGY